MKTCPMILLSFALSTTVHAETITRESLTKHMISECKADLAKSPALFESKDGEAIWKNLEDKENDKIKLSKKCHTAHENYEHKFHRVEQEIEKL